jgi:integrase/recombinase XerD
MRAFPVRLPSGARYWTVLDEDLAVVPVADGFLRQVRFGRDGAESTTKSYAHSIALFLRWCSRTGRTWQAGAAQLPLFISWLQHAGPAVSGADAGPGGVVLAGPGLAPARSARRVNGVLTAVRSMVVHAVAGGDLLPGVLGFQQRRRLAPDPVAVPVEAECGDLVDRVAAAVFPDPVVAARDVQVPVIK